MNDHKAAAPPLATMVLAGETQTEAVRITEFQFMVHYISNIYLHAEKNGDVLVKANCSDPVARNGALSKAHRRGPLKYLILTQSHGNHYGGVVELREPGAKAVGGPDIGLASSDTDFLLPYFGPRSAKVRGETLKTVGHIGQPDPLQPDLCVDRQISIDVASRQIEIVSTPESETIDSLTLWMPDDRIAFVGNFFMPIWLSMPLLNTLSGDKPRLVRNYLQALNRIRRLGSEMLITGQGESIVGAAEIRRHLDRMHDAVSFVRDFTLDGMKAGKTVHELTRDFSWSESVAIGEFYGNASRAIRSIWQEDSGWFHYDDGTIALCSLPQSSIHTDLVDLAGGPDALATRAQKRLDAGASLAAPHIIDIALNAAPALRNALMIKRGASLWFLGRFGSQNLSQSMWTRSEIAECEKLLA